MEDEHIKAWVTKYALTSGISCVEGTVCHGSSGRMLRYTRPGCIQEYAHGDDWHRTPEAALARAEEMRRAKIVSLKKNMSKLETLTFHVPQGVL